MRFSDTYLPLIRNCVSNTFQAKGKSVLITGSNMSGKTTFIRMTGINTLTALTLNTCFARSFSVPRLQLFSAILMNDDLMNDKSFYLEEVQTIKKMIDISSRKEPHLFLLDEIYKGTNTIERVSGSKAVLSWLNRGNNLVLISTHDIELTELLKAEYDLYHFSEQVDDRSISFDYKIKPGKMKTRNAIKILEVNGYPSEVIAEARALAAKIDQHRQRFE
jgi:DNA mismatch repair ATPase MutS